MDLIKFLNMIHLLCGFGQTIPEENQRIQLQGVDGEMRKTTSPIEGDVPG